MTIEHKLIAGDMLSGGAVLTGNAGCVLGALEEGERTGACFQQASAQILW